MTQFFIYIRSTQIELCMPFVRWLFGLWMEVSLSKRLHISPFMLCGWSGMVLFFYVCDMLHHYALTVRTVELTFGSVESLINWLKEIFGRWYSYMVEFFTRFCLLKDRLNIQCKCVYKCWLYRICFKYLLVGLYGSPDWYKLYSNV